MTYADNIKADLIDVDGLTIKGALALYNAGYGTTSDIIEAFELSNEDAARFVETVRSLWAVGRYKERRAITDRRINGP